MTFTTSTISMQKRDMLAYSRYLQEKYSLSRLKWRKKCPVTDVRDMKLPEE